LDVLGVVDSAAAAAEAAAADSDLFELRLVLDDDERLRKMRENHPSFGGTEAAAPPPGWCGWCDSTSVISSRVCVQCGVV
jgi:hypothetical protein